MCQLSEEAFATALGFINWISTFLKKKKINKSLTEKMQLKLFNFTTGFGSDSPNPD